MASFFLVPPPKEKKQMGPVGVKGFGREGEGGEAGGGGRGKVHATSRLGCGGQVARGTVIGVEVD